MKLNKKGISIVELIVSIGLMSVVMIFLYNLLSNVTFEKDDDYIASLNQANRIEIISTIENDLICDNTVTYDAYRDIIDNNISDPSQGQTLTLHGSKTYTITTFKDSDNKYKITYNSGGTIQTWTIKGGSYGKIVCKKNNDPHPYETVVTQCTIPIYTTNINNKEKNNNTLDDIIFTFIKEV